MRWAAWILGLVWVGFASACSGGDDRSAADADVDSDTDSDSDSDADTDTDTDSDAGSDPLDCGGGRYDVSTGLCWQDPMTDNTTWQEAVDYCDAFEYSGHGNWRLPSSDDFAGLLGGCPAEVIDGGEGGCHRCALSSSCTAMFGLDGYTYWSSSTCAGDEGRAQAFNFHNGEVGCLNKPNSVRVRCVRSVSEIDAGLDGGE